MEIERVEFTVTRAITPDEQRYHRFERHLLGTYRAVSLIGNVLTVWMRPDDDIAVLTQDVAAMLAESGLGVVIATARVEHKDADTD
jgi:hypothetical protein